MNEFRILKFIFLTFVSSFGFTSCGSDETREGANSQVSFTKSFSTRVYGFHAVTTTVNRADGSSVTGSQLENFIRRAKRSGFQLVTLTDGIERPSNRKIVLTFDDGYENNYSVAAPILRRQLVPAVFFVHPETIGNPSGAYPKMNWDMVRELNNDPLFEVQSHASFHRDLRDLSAAELEADFELVRATFLTELGILPAFIAYPMGQNNAQVRAIASRYYEAAFSYGTNASSSSSDKYRLPRIDMYLSKIDQQF